MNLFWRRLGLVACLVVSVHLAEKSARADGPPWVEVKSAHFSVVTDAGEKRGREVATRFEQMRAVFAALMTKATVNLPVPLQIVAFKNTKEMRDFAPLWQGKPTKLAGLFQGGSDRSFIMLDLSADNPWSVVFHEYGHQLMNGNMARQSAPWFEEGFAEFFSTIEVDNKEARVGKVPDHYYYTLRQTGMMKVADLFRVQQNSQTYNESGDRRTVFYAQSGMMVHYFYDHQLVPKLTAYFDLTMAKRVPVEDAIQQALGMSAAQLDKEFQNYVSSGHSKYFVIPTPPNIATTAFTTAPLTDADTRAILADIHAHSPDYKDKAIADFEDILKTQPNHGGANRGLGYAYMVKGEYKKAAECYRKAEQADAKDPRVHYYIAMLMSRDGGYSSEESREEMIKELEAAIDLDPSFADAYMLLGFAQAQSGDREKGLETAQKALLINPRDLSYQFNLAQMYLSNQKYDQAAALLHAVENSGNPMLAVQATSALRAMERMKADNARFSSASEDKDETSVGFRDPDSVSSKEAKSGESTSRETPQSNDKNKKAPTKEKSTGHITVQVTGGQQPKVGFLRGVLATADCSAPPSALLSVTSGDKKWKMKIQDINRVALLGADKFSCSWTNKKVALNYVVTGENQGAVISVELE